MVKKAIKNNINKSKIRSFIAIIVLTLIQTNSILYFLDYSKEKWVLALIFIYPLYMISKSFVQLYNKRQNTFLSIFGLIVLSCMFYVGMFLQFVVKLEVIVFVAAVGYIVLFFVLLYMINESMAKVEWTYTPKKTSAIRFIMYFSIPVVIYAFLLIACYPGMISPDSLYILTQVVNDTYNNLHPLLYTLFIRLLTIIGLDLGAIMVLQCLMCAGAYAYIAFSFDKMGLPKTFCFIGVILLSIYPLNLLNTITFWKDIPYTIGLSLITLEIVKLILEKDYFKSKFNIAVLLFGLILALVSRHNGIFTVIVTLVLCGIIFLIKKNKTYAMRFGVILLACVVLFFGSFFGSIALLGDKYQEPQDNKVTKTAMYALRIQGLISVYREHWNTLPKEHRMFIDKYLDLKKVDMHFEKFEDTWRYRSRTKAYVNVKALANNNGDFNRGYINLLKDYPLEVINAYMKTTGIVWAVSDYGYTMHAAYPYDWYDMRKYENVRIKFRNYLPPLKKVIQSICGQTSGTNFYALFWRPALFMLMTLLFLYHALRKRGVVALLVAAPAIINSIGFILVNEAQDARYTYINFTVALIMLAFALIKIEKNKVNDKKVEQ